MRNEVEGSKPPIPPILAIVGKECLCDTTIKNFFEKFKNFHNFSKNFAGLTWISLIF